MSTNIPSAWYADFFTYLPNEFWRRVAAPQWTAVEVAFVEARLGLAAGSRILDVPCGSGRHSLALAARGHRVTGVDLSAEALDHARRAAAGQAAAGQQAAVTFEHRDMRDLTPLGVFDAAVCLGNSFCYFDPAGTREFVAALAAAVRPGGGLVIDVGAAAETVLPGFTGEPRTMRTGDITVKTTFEYDVTASQLISHHQFTQGSRILHASAVHHVWTSGQLGELLMEAGFVDLSRYGAPDGAPFAVGSGRLLLVARKQ